MVTSRGTTIPEAQTLYIHWTGHAPELRIGQAGKYRIYSYKQIKNIVHLEISLANCYQI